MIIIVNEDYVSSTNEYLGVEELEYSNYQFDVDLNIDDFKQMKKRFDRYDAYLKKDNMPLWSSTRMYKELMDKIKG